jgi:hypothetical protein
MANKKLSELYLEKKTFVTEQTVEQSEFNAISVEDAKMYAELVLNEWYSETGCLKEEDEEWMCRIANRNNITNYRI